MFDSLWRIRVPSILFLPFFILLSCTKPCRQWELETIQSDCPGICYGKATLPACSTFNGLEAEILSIESGLRFYLNALSLELPMVDDDVDYTTVIISIGDQDYSFLADRFQGGQQLLLPEDAQNLIIETLLQKCEVDIRVGRYQTTLVPNHFYESYLKL